jgi:peroxiredoxin
VPKSRIGKWLLALAVLVPGAWFGATSAVRAWVDRQLAATHGRRLERVLRDTNGREWGPAELRGRVVVLSFFRSRCESCLAEREALRRLERELDPARALLLSVMMDEVLGYPASETAATLATMEYRQPVVMADAALVDAFHGSTFAHVTPITFVLDEDGRVRTHRRGHQGQDVLRSAVPSEALLR